MRRGKREFVWTAIAFDAFSIESANPLEADIVIGDDWIGGNLGRSGGAVLVAVKGWLHVACGPAVSPEGSGFGCFCAIFKQPVDQQVGGTQPNNPNFYLEEDILWTDGAMLSSGFAWNQQAVEFQGNAPEGHHMRVDVKSKRKLVVDDLIRLTVINGTIGTSEGENISQLSGVLRGLVELP